VIHHPALAWTEIGAFCRELRTEAGITPLALQFTILTAARTGEVLQAKWSEVDLASGCWTIPAGRMRPVESIGFR
jgi:integrase